LLDADEGRSGRSNAADQLFSLPSEIVRAGLCERFWGPVVAKALGLALFCPGRSTAQDPVTRLESGSSPLSASCTAPPAVSHTHHGQFCLVEYGHVARENAAVLIGAGQDIAPCWRSFSQSSSAWRSFISLSASSLFARPTTTAASAAADALGPGRPCRRWTVPRRSRPADRGAPPSPERGCRTRRVRHPPPIRESWHARAHPAEYLRIGTDRSVLPVAQPSANR